MNALADLELRRARWRRARSPAHLLDAEDSAFAAGGLAHRLDRLAVRMLLLPEDPELTTTPTDEGLLERLAGAAKEWSAAQRIGNLWGYGKMATAEGACLFGYESSSAGPWNQYLCLRRDGGLDVGLGGRVYWERDGAKLFHLTAIVARLWSALDLHARLSQASQSVPGEVTLALVDTEGSALGGFAEGWLEPFRGFRDETTRSGESNVLLRIELPLPVEEGPQDLAFRLGALVDNVWDCAVRRFIARTGDFEGRFDCRHGAV